MHVLNGLCAGIDEFGMLRMKHD